MTTPGTYALLLRVDLPTTIAIGALGQVELPAGWYLYLGSARGPGGLAARLARHKRKQAKRFHWHIDYVRAVATMVEIWSSEGADRRECQWAAAAAGLDGAMVIAPGLGSSDCRCRTHLFFYPRRPAFPRFEAMVATAVEREVLQRNPG
jgi:Uri superfamily endonuclease